MKKKVVSTLIVGMLGMSLLGSTADASWLVDSLKKLNHNLGTVVQKEREILTGEKGSNPADEMEAQREREKMQAAESASPVIQAVDDMGLERKGQLVMIDTHSSYGTLLDLKSVRLIKKTPQFIAFSVDTYFYSSKELEDENWDVSKHKPATLTIVKLWSDPVWEIYYRSEADGKPNEWYRDNLYDVSHATTYTRRSFLLSWLVLSGGKAYGLPDDGERHYTPESFYYPTTLPVSLQ